MPTLGDFMRDNGLLYKPYVGAGKPSTAGSDAYNYASQVVQFDDDANKVASAEASVIFAGPPVWNPKGFMSGSKATAGGEGSGSAGATSTFANFLYPIGAVQGFNISGSPQLIPYAEVGSRNKRVAIGVAAYSASMARVLSFHDNLNHAFYQWLAPMLTGNMDMLMRPGNNRGRGQFHWQNLDSEVFRVPFGILEVKVTAGGDVISSRYAEKCYVNGANDGINAGQTLIYENAQIYVTRVVPADDLEVIKLASDRLQSFGFLDLYNLATTFDNSLSAGTAASK